MRGKALAKTSQSCRWVCVQKRESQASRITSPGPSACNITLLRSGMVAGCPGTGRYLHVEAGESRQVWRHQPGTRTSCNLTWCNRSGSVDGSTWCSSPYLCIILDGRVTSDWIFGTLDRVSPPHAWFEVGQRAVHSVPSAPSA